jgi:hypothetical protein
MQTWRAKYRSEDSSRGAADQYGRDGLLISLYIKQNDGNGGRNAATRGILDPER